MESIRWDYPNGSPARCGSLRASGFSGAGESLYSVKDKCSAGSQAHALSDVRCYAKWTRVSQKGRYSHTKHTENCCKKDACAFKKYIFYTEKDSFCAEKDKLGAKKDNGLCNMNTVAPEKDIFGSFCVLFCAK